MDNHHQLLADLLRNNPTISMAHIKPGTNPPELHLRFLTGTIPHDLHLNAELAQYRIQIDEPTIFRTLTCPRSTPTRASQHTHCYNEPIPLGVQIQPNAADWVGTAGAPVAFTDSKGRTRHGFITNWHVASMGRFTIGHPIHQPDTRHSAMATIARLAPVTPKTVNRFDAAIADALIHNYHTIRWEILGIGTFKPTPTNLQPDDAVIKSGRTTGLTTGKCHATNASARVDYNNFTAVFHGLDVIKNTNEPFSAPGDSGSLILTRPDLKPASLLFAGGADLTLGTPIPPLATEWNLTFHPK